MAQPKNGSARHTRVPRESEIEKAMCEHVRAAGGNVRKVKWIGRRGAPDRVVFLPAKRGEPSRLVNGRLVPGAGSRKRSTTFVEVKRPGEKPTPQQAREHQRIREEGGVVTWISSMREATSVVALIALAHEVAG